MYIHRYIKTTYAPTAAFAHLLVYIRWHQKAHKFIHTDRQTDRHTYRQADNVVCANIFCTQLDYKLHTVCCTWAHMDTRVYRHGHVNIHVNLHMLSKLTHVQAHVQIPVLSGSCDSLDLHTYVIPTHVFQMISSCFKRDVCVFLRLHIEYASKRPPHLPTLFQNMSHVFTCFSTAAQV